MQPDADVSCSLADLTVIHHNKPMESFDTHDHEGPECIIPLFGSLTLDFPETKKKHTVKPGQMILIPSETPHAAVSEDRFGERLLLLLADHRIVVPEVVVVPKSQLIVELSFELFEDNDEPFRSATADYLYSVMDKTVRQADRPQEIDTKSLIANTSDERVKKALQIFEQEPGTDLKMADLAAKAGMSERSMQRLFKSELGLSPNTVLAMYRVEKAIRLLRAGDSVTQAAFAVGYSSLSQFISQFRSITGRIPSDYRG